MRRVIAVRLTARIAPLAAYAACFAVTWGLMGLESQLRVAELAVAFVLQVLVGVVFLPTSRRAPAPWIALLAIGAFLTSVALLRDGAGPRPGYGSLLFLPVIWTALRRRPGELVIAIAGAAVVMFAPILLIGGTQYPSSGWHSGALFVVILAVLGVAVVALVDIIQRERDAANELLASQRSLRQVATLVATGAEPTAVFRAVAEQIADLLGATLGGVVRFDGPAGVGTLVGGWSATGMDITGQTILLDGNSAAARVYRSGAAVEITSYDSGPTEPILTEFELRAALSAPILVGGQLWGSAGVSFAKGTRIPQGALERIVRFAELVAAAIGNAHAWEVITQQAATDPVTGLANHRAFHLRLRQEVERAARHGRALSLAIFDLDHFKRINDTHGHQIGDDVLAAAGQRIADTARAGELVARIGGEEFAWLMPETTQDQAYLAAERARRTIETTLFETAGRLTTSAGVCSNEYARSAQELLSAADRALYGAKRSGRNTTSIYAPDTEPRPARV